MAFCGILALSIIIANLTIIIVILRNPRFPTSQLIYKLSLAFADMLVGIFVVPSFISTLYIAYFGSLQRKNYHGQTGANESLAISNETFDKDANVFYRKAFDQAYLNFFGFITVLSLFNSVFTLMFASIDRFRSLSNPLGFNREKASIQAKRITIVMWLVSIIFSLLPVVVKELGPYAVVAGGILITVYGEASLFMVGVALAIPFFMMWIFTISVQINLKRQISMRKRQSIRQQNSNFSTEKQLSKTLSIMIGVFTACILPALLLVLLAEIIPSVNLKNIKKSTRGYAAAYLSLELAASIIFASNSLWNSFIYTFRNKQFRNDAAALFYAAALRLKLVALKKCLFDCFRIRYLQGKKSSNTNEHVPYESSTTFQSAVDKHTIATKLSSSG